MNDNANAVAKEISKRLLSYGTVLLKLYIGGDGEARMMQVGSGSLIRVGHIHGILTAFHCTKPLKGKYSLGLLAARSDSTHHFSLSSDTIEILPIAKPVSDEEGPDLAFITIADWDKIETIKASKSFYPLESVRERMLNDPPEVEKSLWYICGAPNERMENVDPEGGFDFTTRFELLCGLGGVDRDYEKHGFDYAEMDIIPSADDPPPTSFGGISGGGLWQVPIVIGDDGIFEPLDHFLSGVVYYQGVSSSGVRFLRCHFRKSIYSGVFSTLSKGQA